jgi:predicted lipid-binding transport protein (Tim44 family)
MNGFFDFYTILFLVLAVVIFLRLRNVLGRRTGNERQPFDPYSAPKPNGSGGGDKVVNLPRRGDEGRLARSAETLADDWGDIAPAGSDLAKNLTAIRQADPDFHPVHFLDGARAAYEMIVTAFAEGDRQTLKNLLSREVYDGFVGAIADRESRGETMTTNFVGIDKAQITDAALRGRTAHVTVRFVSQLVTVTRDQNDNVIQGDPKHVSEVTDIWTFARDAGARDPNWKLVATEAAE